MTGDDRVRHCSLCKLNVFNLAELTRGEAETLVRETEGRLCARVYRRPDGTVVTKECLTVAAQLRRRTRRLVAAFVGVFGLATAGVTASAASNGGIGAWETWQGQPFRTLAKVLPPEWLPAEPVLMGEIWIQPAPTTTPPAGTQPAPGQPAPDPGGERPPQGE